jgi:hypothetical protein
MARLKIDEHEGQINSLLELTKVEGIDTGKISTIVQALRDNYKEVDTEITKFSNDITTSKQLNDSLVIANSMLLSKLGQPITPQKQEPTPEPKGDVKSLEDIANEFLK